MLSHRRSQFHRSVAAGMAVAALAAPVAQAAPIREPGTGDTPGSASLDVSRLDAPVTTTIDEGFDWGSAAIGAGGAAALIVLVSLGGFKLASRERVPVTR